MTTFYLASSWNHKRESRLFAREVEQQTGWYCTSQWLSRDYQPSEGNQQWALMDLEDIRRARRFILLSYPSSEGGKWTELGYAHAMARDIFYFQSKEHPAEDNIFLTLPRIVHCKSIQDLTKEATR